MDDLLFDRPASVDASLLFGDDAVEAGDGSNPGVPYLPSGVLVFEHSPSLDGTLEFRFEGQLDAGEAEPPKVPYEPNAALLFQYEPAVDGELLFDLEPGEAGGPSTDVAVRVALLLPAPGVAVRVALSTPVRVACALPGPAVAVVVRYASNTERPLVAQAVQRWQDARHGQTAVVEQRWQDAVGLPIGREARWQDATRVPSSTGIRWRDAMRGARKSTRVRFQKGIPTSTSARFRYADALRFGREGVEIRFQKGIPVEQSAVFRYQDAIRGVAGAGYRTRYQDALRGPGARLSAPFGSGRRLPRGWSTRYQDAVQPRPGLSTLPGLPGEPPFDPCYTPDPALLFQYPWADFGDGSIVFFCDNHDDPTDPTDPEPGVIVPIRRIYTVINTATLRRVDGDVLIPNTAMTLTIDVDSWTWSFTATVPGSALPDLEPSGGGPVEVEAKINGVAYRAIVEGISRDRTFGRSSLSVSGRGKSAVLDAPYAPIMTFGNEFDRTVQQLANEVLSNNGVSIGWDIDAGFAVDDWLVPAGVFSHQGSYMSAINAIAADAGAYVQPHRTAQALSILKRYPAKPWEWSDVEPDFQLPADVVQKEAIVWTDKPTYNRVYVRGQKAGKIARLTRAGTEGDIEAPMITTQLGTDLIGLRQRGLVSLADTGRQAAVSLRLPVLPETGIIPPGKFVRYVDGGVTRIGLVRSVSAEIARNEKALTVWQTIGVETHV